MATKTQITTGRVRFSFVNVFTPRSINGSDEKYSVTLLIPKSDSHTMAKIKDAMEAAKKGYAAKSGKKLTLNLGYSHPIEMEDPEGIETTVDGNKVIVSGIDKEKVGQYAAQIREKRGPEPYKGKGIKYDYEIIRRKVGKTGK